MTRKTSVTIMFTDLVGSTALMDRLGDDACSELLHQHFTTLRRAVVAHGGREIKSLGDGLMVAFASPASAAACAASMQRSIARHNRTRSDVALGLRIGLNAGEVLRESGGDLFGMPVIIAKRLCDLCEAGQVLVSASVRDASERAYVERGTLRLKGVSTVVSAATLVWAGAALTAVTDAEPVAV